jgi:hypothetical protein
VQIRGDGLADVLHQRKHPRLVGFARANEYPALMPIEIVEAERGYFMGTEPQPGEEQEQGMIAQGPRGLPRRGGEDTVSL